MKKLFIYLVLIMSTFPAIGLAGTHDYICKIAGYYEGTSDGFLHQMTLRVIEKNHMMDEISCKTDIKFGNNVAHKFFRLGKVESDEEAKVQMHAKHFGDLVYDAILSKIRLDW